MATIKKNILLIIIFNFYTIDSRIAIIFGATGQDGIYLVESLLQKKYIIHAIIRSNSPNKSKLQKYISRQCLENVDIIFHELNILDKPQIKKIIKEIQPNEIYNLAAQSNVGISFKEPYITLTTNTIGTLNILETLRELNNKNIRFFQASSTEIFGKISTSYYTEDTPLDACTTYGESKLFAHRLVKFYRKQYGIFACNGILCNHESPLRGENFITKIVTKAVAEIHLGLKDSFMIGNLNSQRDWGHAKDYVEGMWLMLQQNEPDDYILATQQVHSVKELIEEAFKHIKINIKWKGEGINEVGYNPNNGKILVRINPEFFRPVETNFAVSASKKAASILGWRPTVNFPQLVKNMVMDDIVAIKSKLEAKDCEICN